jgi:hypothetical protein
MKRFKLIILFLQVAMLVASAQVPQKFNYQAVLRDAQGGPVANQSVAFRISILEGSADGNPVYVETHAVTTSGIGLADMVIGNGSVSNGEFASIPWGEHTFYLKVEADPAGGSAYINLGTTQMVSVPYALYSGNISSPTRKFTIQEETGHPVDSALFEVRNAEGQTVFAVYPEGTRVYVLDEEAKGVKGGFAVGGYSRRAKGITQEYLRVTPDSIRLYFDEESGKGVKGGFAVGGYSRKAKGPTDHYFELRPDSAKFLMVAETPDLSKTSALTVTSKSRTGGEGDPASMFNITRDNYFIGHRAGRSNRTGLQNYFIGYESGLNNTDGYGNLFLGQWAGRDNTEGDNNVFIGIDAGQFNSTGDLNTSVGFQSGYGLTTGDYNSIFGFWAGYDNQDGNVNTYVGAHAGHAVRNGEGNTYIGAYTGSEVNTGQSNTFVGMRAGSNIGSDFNTVVGSYAGADGLGAGGFNTFIGNNSGRNATGQNNTFVGDGSGLANKGNSNIFLGSGSGANCLDGSENIFIGQEAGAWNNGSRNVFIGQHSGVQAEGSDMLVIENTIGDSTSALIWGRFDRDILRLNSRVGIGRNAVEHALEVEGEAYKTASNDWATTSDARVKTQIRTIENGLDQIMRLRPVTYRYTEEWMKLNPGIKDKEYYHYIAQEFAEVFPGAVHQGPESLEGKPGNLLRMNSQPAEVVAVRAIQELAEQNQLQQAIIEELMERVAALEAD